MPVVRLFLAFAAIFLGPTSLNARPDGGTLTGIVTFKGTLLKTTPFDLAKESACVKMHATEALMDETVVIGPGKGLANVVVYISAGDTDTTAVAGKAVAFKQQGCHYKSHVLAIRVGQEIQIINSDSIPHNIHPVTKVNREWSRLQPPGTPPSRIPTKRKSSFP